MNKEIEELAESICRSCKKDFSSEYCCFAKERPCQGAIAHAENIYNTGYHKIVWHKVADGDLPEDKRDIVLCLEIGGKVQSVTGYYDICVSNFVVYDLGAVRNQDVIAWTELPKYEGEE